MKKPVITVGLTAYNAQDTIEFALGSVFAQDWPAECLDVIVIDDASTDITGDILQNLRRQHDFDLITLTENKGVACARNLIISKARGDFLAFFDDDDVSAPDRLRKQYEAISAEEDNGVGALCHTARLQIFPDGKKRTEKTFELSGVQTNSRGRQIAERLLVGHHLNKFKGSLATCSQMGSMNLYRNLQFDKSLRRSEDTDFCVRAALNGADFIGIQETLVTQNITMENDKALAVERAELFKVMERHKDFINRYEPFAFSILWAKMKYAIIGKEYRKFMAFSLSLLLGYPLQTSTKIGRLLFTRISFS